MRSALRRLLTTAVGVLVAGLAVGCSNPPHSGMVIDRRYEPGHYYTWTSSQCVARDKRGSCIVSVPIQHQSWVSPDWELCLQADSDDTSHDKTGCLSVSEGAYNAHPVGSRYPG